MLVSVQEAYKARIATVQRGKGFRWVYLGGSLPMLTCWDVHLLAVVKQAVLGQLDALQSGDYVRAFDDSNLEEAGGDVQSHKVGKNPTLMQ